MKRSRQGCGTYGAGLAAVLLLSACASADVAAINKASEAQIDAVEIAEVNVSIDTPRPYPELHASLTDKLRETMPKCATGSVAHRMNVSIREFEEQNVAQAIFVGDEVELGGSVELIDAATGGQTGEYYVKRTFFWGGFIGAAMMSDAHASLSERFAESVCSDIFGVELEKKK